MRRCWMLDVGCWMSVAAAAAPRLNYWFRSGSTEQGSNHNGSTAAYSRFCALLREGGIPAGSGSGGRSKYISGMIPSPARGNRRRCPRETGIVRSTKFPYNETMYLLGYSSNRRIRSSVPHSAFFPLPGRESSRGKTYPIPVNSSRRDSSLHRQGKGTAVVVAENLRGRFSA